MNERWQALGGGFLGPPPLSDKMVDWNALCEAGGETFFRDKDVLDVGPAYGLDAFMFAFYAKSYVVLDSYEVSLDHVARVAPKSKGIECNLMEKWPVADASFDTILDFSTFDDSGAVEHCYREAARALRSQGTLVTSYANALQCDPAVPYTTSKPHELAAFLDSLGLKVHHRFREDGPRSVMFATKW